jgi:NADH-quinone oxidoreductase subunit C
MKKPEDIYAILKERFGEEKVEFKEDVKVVPFIVVAPDAIKEVAKFLRDDDDLDFDYLMCLSGVHYQKDTTLGVTYHINATRKKHSLTLKCIVPEENPHVQSVESIWKTANWHEREAYDMTGIIFDGHPDLRRILCPDDWDGFPLRKDYKVQEYYHGMKVPY